MKKASSVRAVVTLTLLCAAVALLLGFANYLTAGKIAENDRIALSEARSRVLPAGQYTYEELTLPEGDTSVTSAWAAQTDGTTVAYVFRMETKGYASGLVLMCGIDASGAVTGVTTVSSSETPSMGGKTEKDDYRVQYTGLTSGELDTVDGIAGATKTSTAYKAAVHDAFRVFATLTQGGEN